MKDVVRVDDIRQQIEADSDAGTTAKLTGITKERLLRDIGITFPGISVMLRQSCNEESPPTWMIGAEDSARMPDGLPIFSQWFDGQGTHDGDVHTAFTAWLESRGWYLEREDGFWFVPEPIPTPEEIEAFRREFQMTDAQRAEIPVDDGLPF